MGAIGMTFPAIYHIEIPGLRYIEWAYLVNFSISMLGTRRKLQTSAGSMILPEAFKCGFQFRSLTVEAANFMDQVEMEREQLRKSVKDEPDLNPY